MEAGTYVIKVKTPNGTVYYSKPDEYNEKQIKSIKDLFHDDESSISIINDQKETVFFSPALLSKSVKTLIKK